MISDELIFFLKNDYKKINSFSKVLVNILFYFNYINLNKFKYLIYFLSSLS